MNHIIAYSGGIASAMVAKILTDQWRNGEINKPIFLFHDTKTEPKDNDRFRAELSDKLGVPITNVSDGRDIWELFDDEGYLGNARNTMCSRILKGELSLKFCIEKLKDGPVSLYFGFTLDEGHRAQRVYVKYRVVGVDAKFPLIEKKINKEQCRKTITDCLGIQPPSMYQHFDHANCMPCIKGKLAYWGLVHKYEREAWERASLEEQRHEHTILTDGRTLVEAKDHCIAVAEKYEAKKSGERRQSELFDMPCLCT